ncbi:MAG: PQQ-binding-like beta-propeller repeat protein [Paracoccus sp. (in: a-proteobacteria)]|uniref:outer membrane protein assembly factor BamB family protein n=1 Tax=Paracoccus sp. TaxID=267 RepID=UPI0026E05108|nr:PQQ-binding-like beta-propeller repeat protein [Paracoccus sp. (in: a-proteobacteria)]MDO5620471.1 PQQ-binding-like beta-propeller repeat protein [Paracoccus sp. (in: a-proteobacteria)]
MSSKRHLMGAAALAVLALAACGNRDVILPGERLDPRAVTSPDGPAIVGEAAPTTVALNLPGVRAGADWPQRGSNATHAGGNNALAGGGASRIWSAPIGAGDDRRHRIVADPVVAGGLIYTLDSRSGVAATATNGGRVWFTDVRPAGERGDSVSGGGVAYDSGRVFVTTGWGELVALDARSGGVLWRQRVGAPIGGAPTVANGVVYVTGRNDTGWAVRAEDGRMLWTVTGNGAASGVMGVSAPAVSGGQVVFPFRSGQLLAADVASGAQNWSAQVAGVRRGRSVAYMRDLTGDPVIVGNVVYAGTSSGRIDAFDLTSGAQLWSSRDGAASPVLPVGNAVFAVNDQAQLVRLDARNGARVWAVDLPYYTDEKVKKQDSITASLGPVMANGRLFVGSSDGVLRVFDPASGALIGQGAIPGGAASAPVVAGGTLYIVGRDGQLHAFR